jgi:hypothetical protein
MARSRSPARASSVASPRGRTVGTHVENVLAKTGARNRTAVAHCAARWGLLVDGGAAQS